MKLLDIMTAPWAIEPQKLLEIKAIYETHMRGEKIDIAGVEARIGQPLENSAQNYYLDGNVAVIEVDGVIARKANLFIKVSGGVSTQLLARDIREAEEDPAAQHILLRIDSPGGTVDGVQEVARTIREVSARKPVYVLTEGLMASAAYWFGSAADQVFASSETDQIGSIGVVATHVDVSKAEEKVGRKTTEVTAGKYKRIAGSYEPLNEEGRAHLQERVDAVYTIFVNDVATHRGVDVDTVLNDMADGRVFLAGEALKRGLVDGVTSYDALIADLSAGRIQPKRRAASGADPVPVFNPPVQSEGNHMDIKTLREKHPETAAALIEEGRQAGITEGRALGASAELQRIKDVEANALPGHEALITTLKFDGKTTGAEAAVKVLGAERQKQANALAGITSEAPVPAPSAPAPTAPVAPKADASIEERTKAEWDKDSNLRAEFGTYDTYLAYAKANDSGKVRRLGPKAA